MKRPVARSLLMVAFGAMTCASAQQAPPPAQNPPTAVEGGGMPDLERGKLAAQMGHDAEAESNFLPLAQRGYTEAQLALARLYARRQTTQSMKDAIHWFRTAAQKDPVDAEVPLARLLLKQDDPSQLDESQRLFLHAWEERQDPEALAGLIELYTAYPEKDGSKQLPTLVVTAEKLDLPVTNGALISWYRNTRDVPGHNDHLLAMCRKSLNIAPTCYVDLVRDMRERKDLKAMQQMVSAAMSQYAQGLVPVATASGLARALVAAPDGALEAGDDTPVSDAPETDAEDLASTGASSGTTTMAASRSCEQDPVGVTKVVNASQQTAGAPPPVANIVPTRNTAPAAAPGNAKPAAQPAPDANAQPEMANQILAKLAGGSPEARVEAAGVAVRFPYLAPDLDLENILQDGMKQGLADAPLYLGELYLHGARAPRDPEKALDLLQRAAKHPDTALDAQYYIGRLYQYGYLDEVDPQKAIDHLLFAARRGYVAADSALARLYSSGKGVCPDLVNAFVFAQLGARDGAPAIRTLAGQVTGALTPQQRQSAQRLLRQEEAARQQVPQTDLAEATPSSP
ncbi:MULTISPECIES: SEL1-like repeat protein [Dyella]|uniref:Sel1 repeat family protein n=2 Tax=Dyella TaxID=231454 RepID=A0A4R0YUK3_9GAMM|nr:MULTISPECIES: SEL1-like repeat protein [Dyella]TBR39442.1 hypothetical protein EYV96_04295 [Dyella terrae]TCI12972.1 hypothetical protein EZM97_06570 [Dyella soli]